MFTYCTTRGKTADVGILLYIIYKFGSKKTSLHARHIDINV